MSKISLKHSGGKVVSLNSPTTEPNANDVAFKLPNADGSAGQFMKTDGSGNLSFGAVSAGITMADQWRITSSFNVAGSTPAYITSNWERNDNPGYAKIGTGMSESSGEFSFPTTGIYLVGINIVGYSNGGAFDYCSCYIHTTLDNSNYSMVAETFESVERNNQWFAMATETLFDVTDVSTHKVKFKTASNNTRPYVDGSSSSNQSFAHFTRLGDT